MPVDPIGATSLAIDLIDRLCSYCKTVKGSHSEVVKLRNQAESLKQAILHGVNLTLQRPTVAAADTSLVDQAVTACDEAITKLERKLTEVLGGSGGALMEKLKRHAQGLMYPFRREAISDLAENVTTCRDAFERASDLLRLNVAAMASEKLDSLQDSLDGLRLENSQGFAQLQSTLRSDTDREKAAKIVNSLRFPEMDSRRETVKTADDDTFQWVLDTPESNDNADVGQLENTDCADSETVGRAKNNTEAHRATWRSRLRTWLTEDNGLFWLQGKPGSGKSTFVKFLLDASETTELLSYWSAGQEVLLLEHFFWAAGSAIQASELGLLRHLLYQTLNAQTELVPIACSLRWKFHQVYKAWSEKELWSSLNAALQHYPGKVCIMVDGLDEMKPPTEHRRLCNCLVKLVDPARVKILVSCRTWPVFTEALRPVQYALPIHEITRRDMAQYLRNRLCASDHESLLDFVSWECIVNYQYCAGEHDDDHWVAQAHYGCGKRHDQAHKIVRRYLEKAQGVFIWLSLVTDRACELLGASRPLIDLEQILDESPEELYDYYRMMMLDRIPLLWQERTAIALHIASLTPDHDVYEWIQPSSDPLIFWHVSNSTGSSQSSGRLPLSLLDPNFAIRALVEWPSKVESDARLDKTRSFINAACKDFLILVLNSEQDWPPPVTFSHRTLYEFMHTDDMQAWMRSRIAPHFFNPLFYHRLTLLRCKTITAHVGWGGLEHGLRKLPLAMELDGWEGLSTQIRDLAAEYEKLACTILTQPHLDYCESRHAYFIADIAPFLAKHGLCAFTTAAFPLDMTAPNTCPLLRIRGHFNSSNTLGNLISDMLWSSAKMPSSQSVMTLLHSALANGAGPNSHRHSFADWCHQDASFTPWESFLANFICQTLRRAGFKGSRGFTWRKPPCHKLVSLNELECSESPSKPLSIALTDQAMIRLFIEYGADLEAKVPDDLVQSELNRPSVHQTISRTSVSETDDNADEVFHGPVVARDLLTAWLPMDENSPWPAFFAEYSTKETRKRLDEERRERIKYWPKTYLSDADLKLLGLKSHEIDDVHKERELQRRRLHNIA